MEVLEETCCPRQFATGQLAGTPLPTPAIPSEVRKYAVRGSIDVEVGDEQPLLLIVHHEADLAIAPSLKQPRCAQAFLCPLGGAGVKKVQRE